LETGHYTRHAVSSVAMYRRMSDATAHDRTNDEHYHRLEAFNPFTVN